MNAAATAAGAGAPPPQGFERWRFAAKLAEDAAAAASPTSIELDTVIPSTAPSSVDDCVLTADLERAGVATDAAKVGLRVGYHFL